MTRTILSVVVWIISMTAANFMPTPTIPHATPPRIAPNWACSGFGAPMVLPRPWVPQKSYSGPIRYSVDRIKRRDRTWVQ